MLLELQLQQIKAEISLLNTEPQKVQLSRQQYVAQQVKALMHKYAGAFSQDVTSYVYLATVTECLRYCATLEAVAVLLPSTITHAQDITLIKVTA